MRKLAYAFAPLLLAAGCVVGGTAVPLESVTPQPWVGPPRVYALIGERDELGLTSQQVNSLDSLGVELTEQNNRIVAQVRRLTGEDTRRGVSAETAEQVRPLLVQVRDNNQRAQERVRNVLTAEQQRRVCTLFDGTRTRQQEVDRRRREDARERSTRGMGGTRRRGMMGDTVAIAPTRAWSWCGPQPAARDSARTPAPRP